jgi:hypothetical protein
MRSYMILMIYADTYLCKIIINPDNHKNPRSFSPYPKEKAANQRPFYSLLITHQLPYTLKNLMRISFSCSQV